MKLGEVAINLQLKQVGQNWMKNKKVYSLAKFDGCIIC